MADITVTERLYPPLLLPVDYPTIERLHGHACHVCGATDRPLIPAGHAVTITGDGGSLGWPVKACPAHQVPEGDR
jgi:hypothetical protein